jgi:hypothetical protein
VGREEAVTTESYTGYSDRLLRLADALNTSPWHENRGDVQSALNGQAAEQLRVLVPRTVRRAEGAFFTGSEVRERLELLLEDSPSFWDPACGAGDLLLAAAGKLPLGSSMEDTLRQWGNSLHGGDLQPSFVQTARIRLFLLAAARHKERGDSIDIDVRAGTKLLKAIKVANAYAQFERHRSYSGTVLLNPPFGSVKAPPGCSWSSGSVSQAALMTLAAASKLAIGQQLVAILPDVLRSGSRYARWRSSIEAVLDLRHIDLYGQFDDHTDIDVFLLSGRRRRRSVAGSRASSLWWPDQEATSTVNDNFTVSVGTVVDNRDPHSGPSVPFLTARDLGDASRTGEPRRSRNFSGRLFMPPFVAVRRTSRPGLRAGGSARAAGTLVTGNREIAVDNHIIAVKPRDGSIDECFKLIDVLNSEDTSVWLDSRIRCRHLTVGVIRAIPWPRG